MRVSATAESKIAELEEEVENLKEEVKRLWQVIRSWGSDQVVQSNSRSDSRAADRASPSRSYTGYSHTSTSQVSQSVPVAAAVPVPSSAPTTLSWHDREAICVDIGRFLARCISGGHRGTSGRDRIPLPSRLWVIVRDYSGQIYTPVKVVRSWTSCKVLCKPGNSECGDSVFVGLPSEREARKVVQAASLQWPQAIEA